MSRPRKRSYKLPPGKFASIPVDHLKHAAGLLSACELRVWLAVCSQSQPWSNGTAKLCRSVVTEFHLGSWTTVSAATRKLIQAKLIVRTRTFRPRHCALYGVTHMPLNHDAMAKCVLRLIVDKVSRGTWTRIPAAREQNSGVMVDTLWGALE